MKYTQQKLTTLFQLVTLVSSCVILIMLMLMLLRGARPQWKMYQQQYAALTAAMDSSAAPPEIRPTIISTPLPHLKRIDRCSSCHLGTENKKMADADLPYRTHSGEMLKFHPPEKFGCTICHGGQGQAIDKKNAHAVDKGVHWLHPLLAREYLQASCGQCHSFIFSHSVNLQGMETLEKGRQIFMREGCLGCHKARGLGGSKGPDLSEQGGKSRRDYSFRHVPGKRTVSNWLHNHFRDPDMVSPGSQMLAVDLADEDLHTLVVFTMGLNKPDIPLDFFSVETLNELKGRRRTLRGDETFAGLCSACHGKNAKGKSFTADYKWGVPALANQDFLAVASAGFMEMTIYNGRSGRQMAAWTPRFTGLKPQEINDLIVRLQSAREIRSSWRETKKLVGDVEQGNKIYNHHCQVCHGENGDVMPIITLSNPDFLASANDEFIYKTIVNGRRNSAMPAWGQFSSQDLADIIASIRRWGKQSPQPLRPLSLPGNRKNGEQLYHYRCSRCHGLHGEGVSAPAIANADFVGAAGDEYIQAIVANGRRQTAMFGWAGDVPAAETLQREDIADIIAHLRYLGARRAEIIYPGPNLGQAEKGSLLFLRYCAECHGPNGEGIKAPALNNQEFLNSAGNGYILATMSLGRRETAMPSWGRGDEKHIKLSLQERLDITAEIRQWQKVVIKRPGAVH